MGAAKLPAGTAKRQDPEKSSGGPLRAFGVRNLDPTKFYVWASMNPDHDINFEYYEGLEYEIVRAHPDGVRPLRKFEPDSPIEIRGQVLMSCSRERKAQLVQFGEDGDGGQAWADIKERRMIKQGGLDPLRGMRGVRGTHGPYVMVEEEVGPASPELQFVRG